ncbi:MAG: hypothetical protein EBT38_00280 [Acidimicrobiia bacterium]|nr:hypothetical protein [Acidimicrobiia bacterium]NDG10248.1 hypothetical protein [Actinomycetota bacterium]
MSGRLPTIDLLDSGHRGTTVTVLGGVHGDEFEGVLAVRALRAMLVGRLSRGCLRLVAPAHPDAWLACEREHPDEGGNLAREFPGRDDGNATQRVAHHLTTNAIVGSDVLIDLHSAGTRYAMPFLVGYVNAEEKIGEISRRLAETFGADFVWRHDGPPAPGRSLSVAHELGIPAIYSECRGGRSVREREVSGLVDGVLRVLDSFGMVQAAPAPARRPVHVYGDGNTDEGIVAGCAGYLSISVEIGELVYEGSVIATVRDENFAVLETFVAPADCRVMMWRRDARVAAGDTVCLLARPE